jgi:hypothetical protein
MALECFAHPRQSLGSTARRLRRRTGARISIVLVVVTGPPHRAWISPRVGIPPILILLRSGAVNPPRRSRLVTCAAVCRDKKGRVVGFWVCHASRSSTPSTASLPIVKSPMPGAHSTRFYPRCHRQDGPRHGVRSDQRPTDFNRGRADGAPEVNPARPGLDDGPPPGPFGYDVIESLCHSVVFLASKETGIKLIAAAPETTLLSVDDAFKVGRALTDRVTGGAES